MKKKILIFISMGLVLTAVGCGKGSSTGTAEPSTAETSAAETESTGDGEIYVSFGDSEKFTLHLYDSETAAALETFAAMDEWQLPIYHYDDYENWEVMQYYTLPSKYEVPTNPEEITEETACSVYFSEDNEILLFYKDAQVSGEHTQVGYFDYTAEFADAVENNPVLEDWGNKVIHISVNS